MGGGLDCLRDLVIRASRAEAELNDGDREGPPNTTASSLQSALTATRTDAPGSKILMDLPFPRSKISPLPMEIRGLPSYSHSKNNSICYYNICV